MRDNIHCSICNEPFDPNELVEFDGQMLCRDCLERETILCHRCGERLWEDDNAGSDDTPLCERCYENHYTNCSRCGRLLRESDAYFEDDTPYCDDCHAEYRNSKPIRDYYYKPAPIFYGEGNRFMGVELEIDGAGERDDYAAMITELANFNGLEHIYCKHDGSLDDGIEIVTHPMTLAYHQQEMPWGRVLEKARDLDYISHQAGTCGLHVHVNRTAFGQTVREQEACIARVLFFVEKFWDELLLFSRRTQRQMNRWAARYGYKDVPKEILDHVKKGDHQGRYTAVNLTNEETIEFRMFRGTLKLNTLIATLQFVDRICDVALFMSDEELRANAAGSKWELIVVLGGLYGLRLSEILGLRWRNVDLEAKTFAVVEQLPFGTPAGTVTIDEMAPVKSSERVLPIADLTLPYFQRQLALQAEQRALLTGAGQAYYDNDLVIAKLNGTPERRDRVSADFGQLIRRLAMPHMRFHDLRHSAATNMHQLTGDFYTVGMILGHSLKGIGIQLGISNNLESVTAQYVDVRLDRKQVVLDTYHRAVLPERN